MKKAWIIIVSITMCVLFSSLVGCSIIKTDENERIIYNLTFKSDGKVFSSTPIWTDDNIKYPAQTPKKSGYVFDGWYYDDETFSMPFNIADISAETMTENVVVYAKWKNAYGEEINGLVYALNESKTYYTLVKCTVAKPEYTVLSEIDGIPVTKIAKEVFYKNKTITSITLPNSITEIGSYCFSNCSDLSSINLPSSLTVLGSHCFEHTSITSIEIPSGVTRIEEYTFYGCKKLSEIKMSNTMKYIGWVSFSWIADYASISFNGTKTQWDNISKHIPWSNDNIKVFCN